MRRALIFLPLLLLVGCSSSLIENLNEDQANQIIAALSQHGIDGVKKHNADKTWSVSVDNDKLVVASTITREYALPQGAHTNLGELFSRQGLISNPEEDQVRYVYGLTQELSETLEKIDGVLVARVHVVQPERDQLKRQVTAPSASIMIRYRSDYNLDYMRDKIRALVAGSVEGLTPERVSLTLIPVTAVAALGDAGNARSACVAASDGDPHRATRLTLIILTLMVMTVALIVSAWVWSKGIRSFTPTFFRRGKTRKTGKQPGRSTGKDES